ncbi:threonine--tRNA ligase, partial [Candidatus Parcubacteria bacterium]
MKDQDKLFAMRHSCAHVLAAAVKRLYPGAKFGVGPVVDNGFYYDVALDKALNDDDLKKIEAEMRKIIAEGYDMVREEMSIDEAIKLFSDLKQDFKLELLRDLKEKGTTKLNKEEAADFDIEKPGIASIYKTGDFIDLCRGPHVDNVSEIGAFKLWKIAGAYWRGDSTNPQLQRIYGLCFATEQELKDYERMLKEAKKRDHRKLGQELDLFTFSDLVGSGLPLFTPRGTIVREQLTKFVWEIMKPYGYLKVDIPHIAKS